MLVVEGLYCTRPGWYPLGDATVLHGPALVEHAAARCVSLQRHSAETILTLNNPSPSLLIHAPSHPPPTTLPNAGRLLT